MISANPEAQQSAHHPIWKKLWGLQVPPKVKNFLWRACHDCLPTMVALEQRRVEVDFRCPVCWSEAEKVSHVLLECISDVILLGVVG